MGKAENHQDGHWLCDWLTAVSYNIAAPSCEDAYQNRDTRGTVITILKPLQHRANLPENPG